jgi:quinoprotein glucose dehydrogenase
MPLTYMAGGKQYVVIGASGSRDPHGPKCTAFVAYALGD